MDILLDPSNKLLGEFLIFSSWLPGVKGQKLNKFDPTNDILSLLTYPVHLIWTKFGTNIKVLFDSTNKLLIEV